MGTLTENAMKYIEHSMLDLSGDDDFLPFMTIRSHRDEIIYVGLMMPDEPEGKDYIADVMTALCMVHRGVEVTFASSSWMVTCEGATEIAPSKHPDRVEAVALAVVDTEGRFTLHTAPIVRENNMVGVGLWSSTTAVAEAAGRFGNALHMGMDLGRRLPPDMCEFFDAEEAAGRLEEVVQRTAQTICETRKAVWEQ